MLGLGDGCTLRGWGDEVETAAIGWRALEFFAGVGGFASAWEECDIVGAIDIDQQARRIYELNHAGPYHTAEITGLGRDWIVGQQANLWWLSPPCQPYTRRGKQRDIDDTRSAPLLRLIDLIPQVLPQVLLLENVIGFEGSRAWRLLQDCLQREGYTVSSRELCPTELGWPNRRPRFYLLASLGELAAWRPLPCYARSLAQVLGDSGSIGEGCWLTSEDVQRFGLALDRIDVRDPLAVAACQASSYGKSLLHGGSYILQDGRWRRFTPREVAQLLGFPSSFQWPVDLSDRRLWKLLGNSLSLPAVRYILSHLPGGPSPMLPWA